MADDQALEESSEFKVSVNGLKKSFGEVQAVKGIDFLISKGEVYGFLGPNGAGKTTSISMISTYLKPDEGDALVHGKSVVDDPFEVKKVIGVCPQEVALYEDLNAEQNLAFFGRMHGLLKSDIKTRTSELLDFIGLTDKRKKLISTYSGGMKRRLNMACALINNPEFLMLDEPTAGVDPQAREYIYDMIHNLKETGTTILYTTHYMEEAQDLCDRIGIIDLGEIIAEGTLSELLNLVRGKEVVELDPSRPVRNTGDFEKISGVDKVEQKDGTFMITTGNAAMILGDISAVIRKNNYTIKKMRVHTPDLEDIFISLTGRKLRE